ncbi:hypothetical protein BH20CHL6_BH20CHL6_19650 [soil metagenome]
MKQFLCRDLVPHCGATFVGDSMEKLLGQIEHHARDAHGIVDVTPELMTEITRHLREAA